MLRDRGLDGFKFRRQHPAWDYVLDFYCQELSLAVEVDGAYHDLTGPQDAHRQRVLEDRGIRFVRVLADDVERNREAVANYIRTEIRSLPSPAGRGMSDEVGLGEGTS